MLESGTADTRHVTDVIVKESGAVEEKEATTCRDSVHDLCDPKAGVELAETKQQRHDPRKTPPPRPVGSGTQLLRCSSPYDYEKVPVGKPSSLRSLAKLLARITHFSGGDLEPLGVVGKGSYSVVYKCYLMRPGGVTEAVAVKRPRSKTVNNLDNMTFLVEEGVLMQLVTHRSIVKALGFGCENAVNTTEQLSKTFLVEEFLPGGTILDVLETTASMRSAPYSLEDAFRWILSTAEALEYLHALSPMIVHRDVKPDNILLTHQTPAKADAKLTDFGLHRAICPDTGTPSSVLNHWRLKERETKQSQQEIANPNGDMYQMTGGTGSVMYMAPEVMQKVPYNEKVDVFAFGVVMYEVFSGILLRNLYIPAKDRGSGYRRYATRVNSGWRPPLPVEWPEELSGLVSDCWAQHAADRPSMKVVVARLTVIQGKLEAGNGPWSNPLMSRQGDNAGAYGPCSNILDRLCCLW
mmetsp:Transcript_33788/g.95632  ORF Transcript_33788/g.95632 Transcript_33788/m.95632 type:complete len:466 (+) Transcript_33788:142-1539(+)|eukprot:CAMPEP_0117669250 /NCGR_PEP_ID=MMETSP0804-20121206/12019_1 /TAXON_ID=1074897 /ORGANISM="Tetraselmis astigmatica, Strain CCMP880" /LENGTH=465 /DNA_ID=CAMNT_0005477269 /DNA_START=91 /DNA_END=1488 /DNA_ORIENTATION=-